MNIFKKLFVEHCPLCNKVLETQDSNFLKAIVIKSCPDNHYRKEFHPAIEAYIESNPL
ncbi:MAG: hypothetical protein Q8935_07480 [Bacillota bacterium]|nr:hypothetical protein [Bacillota bacterium]